MTSLLERIGAIVGPQGMVAAADAKPFASDWRKRYFGKALAVVKPATTAEVAALMRLACAERMAVVPQGGNTGLVGGATPDQSGNQLILNLSRMNRVRAIDPLNNTMTLEAGCTLAAAQSAALGAGRLFPLSLASEGSCEIGGNLSTNAGGTGVLRYGNTRELTLGLEVVLADGEVWDGLRGLRKDNTGYDLKQLFIGAEGTLGVITAAVLKLFPLPRGQSTAIVAVESADKALALLEHAQAQLAERLVGFELFSSLCLELVLRYYPACRAPFAAPHPQYVLIEISDSRDSDAAREMMEDMLGSALERGLIRDAALATSEAQSRGFWALRENISEAQAHEGKNVKHDVSLPVSRVAEFIRVTDAAIAGAFPGVRMVCFGHMGDGNLHYNVSPPAGVDHEAFLAKQPAISRIVHDSVAHFAGSISAEHGIGQSKRDELTLYKSTLELDMMRKVKAALDPQGIMNPGKVL
jgi:FAD/FMN-containing dehydrogenase